MPGYQRFILIIFACFINSNIYAKKQGQALIDSLLSALPKQHEDTDKVDLLNKLAYTYANIDPDKGIDFAEKAKELAEQRDWKKGIAKAYNHLGINYYNKSENQKAFQNYQEALRINEEIDEKKGIGQVSANIGAVFSTLGDYSKAMEYYLKAISIDEALGDKETIASVTGNIGNIYFAQKKYAKALECGLKALKINMAIPNNNGVADNEGNIGIVYSNMGDYEHALEYSFKALKMAADIGNKNSIAVVTGGIGEIYTKQKNYTGAIQFEMIALELNKEIDEKHNVALMYQAIGQGYLSLVQDTGAAMLQTCVNTSVLFATAKINFNWICDKPVPAGSKELLKLAITYLDSGRALNEVIKEPENISACYLSLAEAYHLVGKEGESVHCYAKYAEMADSVNSKQNNDKILQLELKNDYDRQHFEDSVKVASRELQSMVKMKTQRVLIYIGVGGILLLLGFSFFIVKERGKAEKLLLNILPAEVAHELKSGIVIKAKHFDPVTIMFADFVNFTSAGERMTAQELIEELDICFKKFDEITTRYNVEKIKTIGDAYLAACGLPTPDPKHAENIANAALEIMAFINHRFAVVGNKTFQIRIGIHTGSVVAGIVGSKKFAYDIWGDSVNTAARMEQNSQPGKINISQSTYELIKDKFNCEYRGEIEAKNKGRLKMYFVEA